jgi:hypothetical protein
VKGHVGSLQQLLIVKALLRLTNLSNKQAALTFCMKVASCARIVGKHCVDVDAARSHYVIARDAILKTVHKT